MPKRSQLNVILDPSLIAKVKSDARRKGFSMSEYITYLISQEHSENDGDEIKALQTRLSKLESHIDSLKNNSLGQAVTNNIKAFTEDDSVNFTNFIRLVFKKIIQERSYKTHKSAWEDFLPHVVKFDSWDLSLTSRLKEVLLFEEPEPWSAAELNKITKGKTSPNPIREALISWTEMPSFPDQQTICEKGEQLVSITWT